MNVLVEKSGEGGLGKLDEIQHIIHYRSIGIPFVTTHRTTRDLNGYLIIYPNELKYLIALVLLRRTVPSIRTSSNIDFHLISRRHYSLSTADESCTINASDGIRNLHQSIFNQSSIDYRTSSSAHTVHAPNISVRSTFSAK